MVNHPFLQWHTNSKCEVYTFLLCNFFVGLEKRLCLLLWWKFGNGSFVSSVEHFVGLKLEERLDNTVLEIQQIVFRYSRSCKFTTCYLYLEVGTYLLLYQIQFSSCYTRAVIYCFSHISLSWACILCSHISFCIFHYVW